MAGPALAWTLRGSTAIPPVSAAQYATASSQVTFSTGRVRPAVSMGGCKCQSHAGLLTYAR